MPRWFKLTKIICWFVLFLIFNIQHSTAFAEIEINWTISAASASAYAGFDVEQKVYPFDSFPFSAYAVGPTEWGFSKAEAHSGFGNIKGKALASVSPGITATVTGSSYANFHGEFTYRGDPLLCTVRSIKSGRVQILTYSVSNSDIGIMTDYSSNSGRPPPPLVFVWILSSSLTQFNVALTAAAQAWDPPTDNTSAIVNYSIAVNFLGLGEGFNCEKPLKGGVTIRMENHAGGIRIKRIKKGEPDRFIGACLYPYGKNFDSALGDYEGFRWKNMDYDPSTDTIKQIDVYIYYPNDPIHNSEWLFRRSYSSEEEYNLDREQFIYGRTTWDGPPPLNSEELALFLNSSSFTFETMGFEDKSEYKPTSLPEDSVMKYVPGSYIVCTHVQDNKWFYNLIINDPGSVINQGDMVKFEGQGIGNGSVVGDATLEANGAWSIKEAFPGRVIFVANKTAEFPDGGVIDAFVIEGKQNAVDGFIDCTSRGYWIGRDIKVSGPILPPDLSGILLLLLSEISD